MNKKGPLGRGLAALIDTSEAVEVKEIATTDISPNPHQPRKKFDQERLDELVKSIKTQGIIQPIVVTTGGKDSKYTIVVGERRWRAAKQLGMAKIPALVKAMDKKEMMEAALIENIQREDLNPIDLAEAYKRLMDEFKHTQEELAEVVGRSRSSVANIMRLLKLSEKMQDAIRDGKITEGHGRALLSVEDKEREKMFHKMLNEKITVRDAEKKGRSKNKEKDISVQDLENKLSSVLKTKVLLQGRKKKGKLVIEYYSWEQLEGIIARLEGEADA